MVEHADLALRGDPARVQDPLGAQSVDQHHQLMGGEVEVEAGGQLAETACLIQVTAQPGAEAVELRMLQVPQSRRAERPAPEADLDLFFCRTSV